MGGLDNWLFDNSIKLQSQGLQLYFKRDSGWRRSAVFIVNFDGLCLFTLLIIKEWIVKTINQKDSFKGAA